jgi:hypothetical protein
MLTNLRNITRIVVVFSVLLVFGFPSVFLAAKEEPQFVIPVLIVKYFPVDPDDMIKVEGKWGGVLKLSDARKKTDYITDKVIQALEEGSRYKGFKNTKAPASLKYVIAGKLEFLNSLPLYIAANGKLRVDKNEVMVRINIKKWIDKGVKEVWVWGYDGEFIELCESNMSGPYGDISNSYRDPKDLPIFDKTYTVYEYNYLRGVSEAVEDHIHQIEALLRSVDEELFWNRFVGYYPGGKWIKFGQREKTAQDNARRCGWAHYPPNGEKDYDWGNKGFATTDIEDWQPDSLGQTKSVNCRNWGCDSLGWFIYWMQNIPGKDNGLNYKGKNLTNWWIFVGDFDNAMKNGIGLYQ